MGRTYHTPEIVVVQVAAEDVICTFYGTIPVGGRTDGFDTPGSTISTGGSTSEFDAACHRGNAWDDYENN